VAGRQREYAYDNIGNRQSATGPGGESMSYTVNTVNQYTDRDVPAWFDLAGTAKTNATVTVNYQSVTRQADGAYWYKALGVDNDVSAAYSQAVVRAVVTNAGPGGEDAVVGSTGNVFVAQSPEAFAYDEDGNLLSDGRWTYEWNGENRLAAMETLEGLPAAVPRIRLQFAYDYMGRRAGKVVSEWTGTAWQPVATNLYIYDGWNPIRELCDSPAGRTTNAYVWGLDLSGSLQGAGGIGGLIHVLKSPVAGVAEGQEGFLFAYDANGNVGQLLDVTNGALQAHYEYDPYGNPVVVREERSISATGGNPFRFSTKYRDPETGLYYYGQRFYNPPMGRWLNWDPIAEDGGYNLYVSLGNDPATRIDAFGMRWMAPIEVLDVAVLSRSFTQVTTATFTLGSVYKHSTKCWRINPGEIEIGVTVHLDRSRTRGKHEYEHVADYHVWLHDKLEELSSVYTEKCFCDRKTAECVSDALLDYAVPLSGYLAEWKTILRVDRPYHSRGLYDIVRPPDQTMGYRMQYERAYNMWSDKAKEFWEELTYCCSGCWGDEEARQ